jgi:hypothetical protein
VENRFEVEAMRDIGVRGPFEARHCSSGDHQDQKDGKEKRKIAGATSSRIQKAIRPRSTSKKLSRRGRADARDGRADAAPAFSATDTKFSGPNPTSMQRRVQTMRILMGECGGARSTGD